MTGDVPTARTGYQQHAQGWRLATESSWTLWHTGGSGQLHPRYASASTKEGCWWPATSFTRQHRNDKTKVYSVTPWLPTEREISKHTHEHQHVHARSHVRNARVRHRTIEMQSINMGRSQFLIVLQFGNIGDHESPPSSR